MKRAGRKVEGRKARCEKNIAGDSDMLVYPLLLRGVVAIMNDAMVAKKGKNEQQATNLKSMGRVAAIGGLVT